MPQSCQSPSDLTFAGVRKQPGTNLAQWQTIFRTTSSQTPCGHGAPPIATWRINSRQSRHQERLADLETAREQDRQRLARSVPRFGLQSTAISRTFGSG